MEIFQPSWRGRSISSRKDSNGKKYTAMIGPKSLLYIPVNVLPNAVYKITLELCRESGNGVVYCNLYGNRSFDFHHSKVICESGSWTTFDVDVLTKTFPKTVPIVFRLWRGKEGTGTVLVRRVVVKLEEGPVEKVHTIGKVISTQEPGPVTPNPLETIDAPKPKQHPATRRHKPKQRRRHRPPKRNKAFDKIECFKHHNRVPGGKKVLYLPANNLKIFQTGMYDAFIENGFELYTFDFRNFYAKNKGNIGDAFLKLCREFRPDWIHMQLQFTGMIPPHFVKAVREELPHTRISNWTGDIRSEAKQYFIEVAHHVDLPLISSEGQLRLYRNHGCPHVGYWQIGVDPKMFHPLSEADREKLHKRFNHDVVFCAVKSSHFPDSHLRHRTVQVLNKHFGKRFAIYGDGWGRFSSARGHVDYYAQNSVYNGAKIAINVNHFNSVEMYFSDRQLITMASGTPVICHYIPGLERYFENHKDVAWFKSLEECLELVSYYLENPEKAAKMGQNGAKKVLEQHSYSARVKELGMRLGLIKSSNIEIRREICYKNGDPVKVLGVLPSSPDRRFKFRTTIGKIEFQGVLLNDDVKRIAAEFQPDLMHFYVKDFSRLVSTVKGLREMLVDTAFSCFFDNVSQRALDGLKYFDYIVSNSVPEEMENNEKPVVISMNTDVTLREKSRADMIEEVLFVIGEKK